MKIHFKDEMLIVSSEINMREEVNIANDHNARDLSNSIKIEVRSEDAHFIQFVTRITPDIFSFNMLGIQQWDSTLLKHSPHYMSDAENPRWKVDVINNSDSCYYDEGGTHIRKNNQTIMYDCPGGAFIPDEERAIFCTFVIVNNQVTYKIRWSVQKDRENNSFYCVDVQNSQRLPEWAIKTLTEDYNRVNGRTFKLSNELIKAQCELTIEQLNVQSKDDFLSPPESWIARKNFPILFEKELDPNKNIQLNL